LDQKDKTPIKQPWYKYPMVWFVIGLPLIAVVASIATLVIAVKHSPVVLEHNVSYQSEEKQSQDQ